LEAPEVNRILKEFAETVVRAAKLNLMPGSLKESIDYDLEGFDSGVFTLEFIMNYYGVFQDRGVSGTQVKYLTKYSFSSKQPPTDAILPWVKRKRIRFRDAGGRFTNTTFKQAAFVIARSIKRKGIRPTYFFSKPFDQYFNTLDDEVLKGYGLEVDKAIDSWMTNPVLKKGQNINIR